jgi:hypothetical protein
MSIKKTKGIRIYYSTWKKIRRVFYPRKDETTAEYLDRFLEYLSSNPQQAEVKG